MNFWLASILGLNIKGDAPKGTSFGGFLVGAGHGKLDYRVAALVQNLPGPGGGLLCVINDAGELEFRTNESEDISKKYPLIEKNIKKTGDTTDVTVYRYLDLRLKGTPVSKKHYTLTLTLYNEIDKKNPVA